MPKKLNADQISQYERNGFVFPVEIMSETEALDYRHRLEEAEARYPEVINGSSARNNAHLTFEFLDEIVHKSEILDAVEDVIGENILAWGSVLFIKEAHDPAFVSPHQDFTYMGLEPHDGVSIWLALSPSTGASGCMQMYPGTHRVGQLPHKDTFSEHNILTRGQVVEGLDPANAVDIELRPGQMSLHHPRVVHGSQPNRSDTRRIGIVVQAYLPPHVRSLKSAGHVSVVRGADVDGHFEALPRPSADMEPNAVALRDHINQLRYDVLYDGAEERRVF